MKITFLGATREVTGSNFLIEALDKKILVDCGMIQGREADEEKNFDPFLYNPADIDYLLLTHSHIDHSGRIPKLCKDGFKGKILTTKATKELCDIMLADSAYIQESEAEWKNRKRKRQGREIYNPLYTIADAEYCMQYFEELEYQDIYEIDENIRVRFVDAGHMLGSAIIELWVTENGKTTKTVFSGDLGNNDTPLLASPTHVTSADYLVMESTYGSRIREEDESKAEKFLDTISKTLKRGGNVVIPSFSVGRTQEILYELNKLKDEYSEDKKFQEMYKEVMEANVYVDSPLAITATEVFKQNADLFDEETKKRILGGDNPLEFKGLKLTKTTEESKSINENNEPKIIISASGMCDIGRIKHHLKHNLWNPINTILFVGYQAPGTLGNRIVSGEKSVKIFGEEIAVNAEIVYIDGYSGHADQNGLLDFVDNFKIKPKGIFLVHGDLDAQIVLKEKIDKLTKHKSQIIIPSFGEEYEICEILRAKKEIKHLELYNQRTDNLKFIDILDILTNKLNKLTNNIKETSLKNKLNQDKNEEEKYLHDMLDTLGILKKEIKYKIGEENEENNNIVIEDSHEVEVIEDEEENNDKEIIEFEDKSLADLLLELEETNKSIEENNKKLQEVKEKQKKLKESEE